MSVATRRQHPADRRRAGGDGRLTGPDTIEFLGLRGALFGRVLESRLVLAFDVAEVASSDGAELGFREAERVEIGVGRCPI